MLLLLPPLPRPRCCLLAGDVAACRRRPRCQQPGVCGQWKLQHRLRQLGTLAAFLHLLRMAPGMQRPCRTRRERLGARERAWLRHPPPPAATAG